MEMDIDLSYSRDEYTVDPNSDSNITDKVYEFIDKIVGTENLDSFDNYLILDHLATSYILIVKVLEREQINGNKLGFELFQILFNELMEAKLPSHVLLHLLYKHNIVKRDYSSSEDFQRYRCPKSVEIMNILKIFDQDLDQIDRFYFISCISNDNLFYIKMLRSWACEQSCYDFKSMINFIFHLTIYFLHLNTTKISERPENISTFLKNLGNEIQELFKDFCIKIPPQEELSSYHCLMVYLEYYFCNWIFLFQTDFMPKLKTIIKKHDDYKVNRLFMIALYIPSGQAAFWEYLNKSILFLLGSPKVLIDQEKIIDFCICNSVPTNFKMYKCSIFDFEINQSCLIDPHFKYSKAYDESMQIIFLKGEQTSVNIQNKNLKNMITIKIDKVPLVRIIMRSLYSHEGRNLINEKILMDRPIEADLVLNNYAIILNSCIVVCQHWYKQYFDIDK